MRLHKSRVPQVSSTTLFMCINCTFQGEGASVKDAAAAWIIDCYLLKVWAIKLATNAVNTVLRVDQVS